VRDLPCGVRGLRFGPSRRAPSLENVLSPAHALELAARHQRRAVRDAIAHAAALRQPVGFLCRPGAAGAEFEAVALGSARTCAVIDAAGRLRYVSGLSAGAAAPSPV